MSSNIFTHRGSLVIYSVGPQEVGNYTCIVKTLNDEIIKKEITINEPSIQFRAKETSTNSPHDTDPPLVRIVPVEQDLKVGGKIELECITGKKNNF